MHVTKYAVFSSICKLTVCPGDFQAILFLCDIVAKSNFFFKMDWRSQGHTKQVHNTSPNCLFFEVFVNYLSWRFQWHFILV